MTLLTNFRPAARRVAVAALSSAVLLGSAAATGAAPVASSQDAGASQVAGKTVKTKVSGRKIT